MLGVCATLLYLSMCDRIEKARGSRWKDEIRLCSDILTYIYRSMHEVDRFYMAISVKVVNIDSKA